MSGCKTLMLFVSVLLLLCASGTYAGCPHAARMLRTAGSEVTMPANHPTVAPAAPTVRTLKQANSRVSADYLAAFRRLIADMESVVADCQFSLEGMNYNSYTGIVVNSDGVFFPAASWLRAFFHDAGTFIKSLAAPTLMSASHTARAVTAEQRQAAPCPCASRAVLPLWSCAGAKMTTCTQPFRV